MPRDVQRFRKTYSYYRPKPQEVAFGAGGGVTEEELRGLDWKQSVLVATATNITLSPAPAMIDGVTLVADARVLVKDQSSPAANGIYYFDSGSGNLVRALDAVDPALTSAAAVFVESGATNGGCAFVLTTQDPITVGTTAQTWVKFAGSNPASYTTSFTSASLVGGMLTINHNLSSKYVSVFVYDDNDKLVIPDEIIATSSNVTSVDLSSFSVTGTWNVVVFSNGTAIFSTGVHDPNASYLVLSNTGSLNNERALIASTGITAVDGGANSSYTLSIDDSVVATVSGTTFTGVTKHTSGLSGSLTNLTDGSSYLVAGSNITITSASNGSVTINSSGGGGGSFDYASMYIPDPTYWESTGITAPISSTSVLRIGSKLYLFGGYDGTVSVNNIYSGSWVENPTFSDTGFTLPAAINAARTAIVNDKIYIFGSCGGSTAIYSASLSNPLDWGNTGATLPSVRDNAALVIDNERILIIKGYTGAAGTNTFLSASTSNPLSWTTTSAIGSTAWEVGGFATEKGIFYAGGVLTSTTIGKISTGITGSLPTSTEAGVFPSSQGVPTFCHNGLEIFAWGAQASPKVYTTIHGRELASNAWMDEGNVIPVTEGYNRRMNWIGPDGRYYFIRRNTTPWTIYRSGRRAVRVLTAISASYPPYAGLPGTLLDGTPAAVSPQVRMGMEPWRTNRTGSF